MSAAARRETFERYRESIQRAVSCISLGVITTQAPRLRSVGRQLEAYSLALQGGDANDLLASAALVLRVQHQFSLASADGEQGQRWRAAVAGYYYTLDTATGAEVVAYHWHANRRNEVAFPHLHVGVGATGSGTPILPGALHKTHFPTGPIEIEDVIRLAIVEFGAQPRRHDWEAVLETTRRMRAEA